MIDSKVLEHIFDGFSYAFEYLFIDRSYVLVEPTCIDQSYMRNNRRGVFVVHNANRYSVRA